MNTNDETLQTVVIAWAVIVTILLAILLPYSLNMPTMPALFYQTVTGRADDRAPAGLFISGDSAQNPDGLVVWYDFEEDIARNHGAADRSGSGSHATAKGLFIGNGPGIVGNSSLALSGLGYLYSSGNPAAGLTNVTFSLWFTPGDRGRNERLAGALSAGDPKTGWVIGTRSSEIWDDAGAPVRVLTAGHLARTPVFSSWNHKALVYNGTRVVEYLNGQVISDYAASGNPAGAGREVLIGSWQPFGQNYAGQIDEFRIYDRALSPEQVLDLYRAGDLT